jgi:hypothetical protein
VALKLLEKPQTSEEEESPEHGMINLGIKITDPESEG